MLEDTRRQTHQRTTGIYILSEREVKMNRERVRTIDTNELRGDGCPVGSNGGMRASNQHALPFSVCIARFANSDQRKTNDTATGSALL